MPSLPELDFDYAAAKPLSEIKAHKQKAKRHFGVHGYFTRQSYDVVQGYIENFTKPGDLVLDPFGGYGVTLIEALMLGRKAIHTDINPLANFIAKSLIAPVSTNAIWEAVEEIEKQFVARRPQTSAEVTKALRKFPYPKGNRLSKDADVDTVEQLFTGEQLAQLALLKYLIHKTTDGPVRDSLLLAFSSTLTKINRTYHPSTTRGDNAGDSAAFRYYRYRIAPSAVSLDVWGTFYLKVRKLVAAKKEMAPVINAATIKNAAIRKSSATELKGIAKETVDYIYTDPPYGAKIAYLDLSTMWNAWLDLPVTDRDYQLEAIEGGSHEKTKEDYSALLRKSIAEMYRVLKFDRWLSFVFQHKDPAYWHLIVDTCQKAGFEYVGTVAQRSGQTTFKKRQNPFTVLHGQLIINSRKVENPQAILKVELGADIADIVVQTIEGAIAKYEGATIEQIYDELIVRGMELGFLHDLSKSSKYQDLTPLLRETFDFNEATKTYNLKKTPSSNRKYRCKSESSITSFRTCGAWRILKLILRSTR